MNSGCRILILHLQAAILAGAVIGSFSWTATANAYWLSSAFWYCSLFLSILAILLSAQQLNVLDILSPRHTESKPLDTHGQIRQCLPLLLQPLPRTGPRSVDVLGAWQPRWKMVFTWQCSIMFLSYSVCLYLAGLTIFVCTPLIRNNAWRTDSNVRTGNHRKPPPKIPSN